MKEWILDSILFLIGFLFGTAWMYVLFAKTKKVVKQEKSE